MEIERTKWFWPFKGKHNKKLRNFMKNSEQTIAFHKTFFNLKRINIGGYLNRLKT